MRLILAVVFLIVVVATVESQLGKSATNHDYLIKSINECEKLFNTAIQNHGSVPDEVVVQKWDQLLMLFFNAKQSRLNVAQQLQMLKMDLLYREHFRDYDYNFQIYFALEKILKDYLHNILSQDGKVAVKQITELLPGLNMKISNEFTDISDLLSHGIPNFHQFGLDKLITNLELLQLICDNGFELEPGVQDIVYAGITHVGVSYEDFRYKHIKTFEVTSKMIDSDNEFRSSNGQSLPAGNAIVKIISGYDDFASNQMANELPLTTITALIVIPREFDNFKASVTPTFVYLLKAAERYYAHYIADTLYNAVQKENAHIKLIQIWGIILTEIWMHKPPLEEDDIQRLLRVDLMIGADEEIKKDVRIAETRPKVSRNFQTYAETALKADKRLIDVFAFFDHEIFLSLTALAENLKQQEHKTNLVSFLDKWKAILVKMIAYSTINKQFEWSISTQNLMYKIELKIKEEAKVPEIPHDLFSHFRYTAQFLHILDNTTPLIKNYIYVKPADRTAQGILISQYLTCVYNFIYQLKTDYKFTLKPQYMRLFDKLERDIASNPYLSDVLDSIESLQEVVKRCRKMLADLKKP